MASVSQIGSGTTILTNVQNTYSGGTQVTAGTLLVNNTSGSGTGSGAVQVNGGTLGGTGTISGAVGVSTGTLSPGGNAGAAGSAANVGRLTTGALTLSSTATAIFDLNGGTNYDQSVVNGNLALGGSTLTLNVNPSAAAFSVGQTLDLLHSNGGTLTGTFANFANGGSYLYGSETFLATYTSNDFILTVTSVPEPATWAGAALLCGAAGLILRCRNVRLGWSPSLRLENLRSSRR